MSKKTYEINIIELISTHSKHTNTMLSAKNVTVWPEKWQLSKSSIAALESLGAHPINKKNDSADILLLLKKPKLKQLKKVTRKLKHNATVISLNKKEKITPKSLKRKKINYIRPGLVSWKYKNKTINFIVETSKKNIKNSAELRIKWAKQNMPICNKIITTKEISQKISSKKIALSLILEPKTAVLAILLKQAGAQVAVFSRAIETDNTIAKYLRSQKITVFADQHADNEQDKKNAESLINWQPEIIIDDGAHILALSEKLKYSNKLIGVLEETTSGVKLAQELFNKKLLNTQVIATNNAKSKSLFDNAYGTGYTCIEAISRIINQIAGQKNSVKNWQGITVGVIGYGLVGAGCAKYAKALGAKVAICETNSLRAMQSIYDGHTLLEHKNLVEQSDIIISATGAEHTIKTEDLFMMKPKTLLAVAGGVQEEIAIKDMQLRGAKIITFKKNNQRKKDFDYQIIKFRNKKIFLAAFGEGVNYTAAEGNPIEIMDLSFASQLVALSELLSNPTRTPGVYEISESEDLSITNEALAILKNIEYQKTSVSQEEAYTQENIWQKSRFTN